MGGSSFSSGLLNGLESGIKSAILEGIIGGLEGGLDALSKGANFWTGNAKFDSSGACSLWGSIPDKIKEGWSSLVGKYVGKFEGVNVYETAQLGSIHGSHSAVTIPGRGIITGKGVYTSGKMAGLAMMQHEFGHILQFRKHGAVAYWTVIAPESAASLSKAKRMHNLSLHYNFWTETYANYLSKGYFGKRWIGGSSYPARNISLFNLWRM